ncbi:MAG TPA: TOBE domain-containing protein, partial [Candidatus Acidoferrales bacterium]|nr:TOBE domain-containing protein [Candidatus Acidoferrales bacterium]
ASNRGKVETPIGLLHCLTTRAVKPGDWVLLGFRPAALRIVDDGCAGKTNTFRAEIAFTSFAGDFLECQLRVENQPLRAFLDPYWEFKTGDVISLHIPPERLATITAL